MTEQDNRRENIPTNLRLLLVLEEIAKAGVPVTPTEVNQKLGLPKPTIHRLFATLEEEGFLQREIDGRFYTVGRRFRATATDVLSSLRIRTVRLSIMNALADKIGETCNIALPENNGMIYLERVETKWPLRIQLPTGTLVPFYCTASGKMYLSTLKKSHLQQYIQTAQLDARTDKTIIDQQKLLEEIELTRKRGYAEDDEEFMEGMIAIAIPIIGAAGRLVSTLSFHAPTQRLVIENARQHIDNLRVAANELSELILD